MNYVIGGRRPASVFRYFEEISAIPRPSYHEEAVADYLEAFAKARGLYCYRDKLSNVLIKAPATKGREQEPPILLQGHTDMVCEKNQDVTHDFLRDPLKLCVKGNLLTASGTTLGADNGIAVAMMLALLDGEVASHPAYECLFTTAEEVGLEGAHGFDYSLIQARRMVNLDSESLGVITCGCTGGVRSDMSLPVTPVPFRGSAVRVSIKGLRGGHSGENIHCGRANANKLMGRLLASLRLDSAFSVVSICGGSKDNAIPRECEAVLATEFPERVSQRLTELATDIAKELVEEDRGFTCVVEDAEPEAVMFSDEDTLRLITVLSCAANGVLAMNREIEGLVEYSRNLAILRTEDACVHIVFSTRSAMEARLDASMAELDALAAITHCTTHHYSRYPGWNFATVSPLRTAYANAYQKITGKEATVTAIHAGLECGIIISKLQDMDAIAIGPNMFDLHSPDEAMDLDSVETFWKTLEQMLLYP